MHNETELVQLHYRRNSCRLCKSEDITTILSLKPVPVGEHYFSKKSEVDDRRFPIDLYRCQNCFCIQTQDDINPEYLWSGYTYYSGQTKGIVNHFEEFVESLQQRYGSLDGARVFDIGSNDGSLLRSFKARGGQVYGVDPSDVVAKVAAETGIETFVGLFSDSVVSLFPEPCRAADIITAFNVFAHSPDMQGMLRGVKLMLKPDGLFCFEVQYLGDIVSKKLLGTVFHEHMIHYSATTAQKFLQSQDLHIIDLERNSIQMGSVIFYCAHVGSPYKASASVSEILNYEKEIGLVDGKWSEEFREYILQQRAVLSELRKLWHSKNYRIIGYGAARSGPTLAIQFGLENCLEYIVDDHSSKCGKFGAFESLEVKPTTELYRNPPDVAVILAWIHTKRIIANNVEFLRLGGKFITLWPDVREVTFETLDQWLARFDEVKG